MAKTKQTRRGDQADNPTAAEEPTATAVADNPAEDAEDDFRTAQ